MRYPMDLVKAFRSTVGFLPDSPVIRPEVRGAQFHGIPDPDIVQWPA
jgi:hypothetical protein